MFIVMSHSTHEKSSSSVLSVKKTEQTGPSSHAKNGTCKGPLLRKRLASDCHSLSGFLGPPTPPLLKNPTVDCSEIPPANHLFDVQNLVNNGINIKLPTSTG